MDSFPLLQAEDIEVKVGQVTAKGVGLLLYKTARTDMAMLDKIVGTLNWKCSYQEIKGNLFCTISLWDSESKQWIDKSDCGTESRSDNDGNEKKGEASDAFKRAGTKCGIGRELYTSPFIFVTCPTKAKTAGRGYEMTDRYTRFDVANIGYDNNGHINALTIKDGKGKVVYELGKRIVSPSTPKPQQTKNEPAQATKAGENVCLVCGVAIPPAVATFSLKKHGKPLCVKCQKNN